MAILRSAYSGLNGSRTVVAFANVKEQREALLALKLSRCQRLLLGAGAVPTG
jgi:hypothetical protein